MTSEILSKYYPMAMKCSGYLLLYYEDTSAIDFGADWSIRSAGHGPKVGQNKIQLIALDRAKVKDSGRNFKYFLTKFSGTVYF